MVEEVALREALSRREGTLREARTHFNEWRAARGKPPLPPRRETYADHLQPIVLVAMNTGLRRSELFHLRWEDIDFEAKWLTVQGVSSKNGQTRRIPLNAEALSTLETWRTLRRRANPKFFRASAAEQIFMQPFDTPRIRLHMRKSYGASPGKDQPVRLVADENCDFSLVTNLRAAGYDVVAISEQMAGAEDQTVTTSRARNEGYCLRKTKDFGSSYLPPPSSTPA